MLQKKFDQLLPLQQWVKIFSLNANKTLGQNFLFDLNITDKIVKLANLNEDSCVLEIGPGLCGLTISLLKTPIKKLYVIEKDQRFQQLLEKIKIIDDRLHIIFGDALQAQLPVNISDIVANLPYNISVLFIINILKNPQNIKTMTVLLQKEVAERFISSNKCKIFGKISILGQIFAEIKIVYCLPPSVFIPHPKVDSALVNFKFKNKNLLPNMDLYERILTLSFGQRRKILTSTLGKAYPYLIPYLEKKRCEDLNVEDVINFAEIILSHKIY